VRYYVAAEMRTSLLVIAIIPSLITIAIITAGEGTRSRIGPTGASHGDEAIADIRGRITRVISDFEQIPLSATDSPWRIFHSLHAKMNAEIMLRAELETIPFDRWLSHALAGHETYAGLPLVYLDRTGPRFSMALRTRGIGLEAHLGQFEWILSGAGIPADSPVLSAVTTESRTLADCYETMLESVNEYSDLSWALPVAILHVANPRQEWRNCFGVSYSLERMIQQHLETAETSVHCCGMHWYIALAATSHRLDDLSPEFRDRVAQQLALWIHGLKQTGFAGSARKCSPDTDPENLLALTYVGHALEAIMTLDLSLRPDWRDEQWLRDGVTDLLDLCEAPLAAGVVSERCLERSRMV